MKLKMTIAIGFFLVGIVANGVAQTYKGEIRIERKVKDEKFRSEDKSPLDKEKIDKFKSLPYFSIKRKYRIEAELELSPESKVFEMPTTTERRPKYRQYGLATFVLNGKKLELPIFQNQDLVKKEGFEDHLFVPFNDLSNGFKSYGGGRFIDVRIPEDDTRIVIDFNKAYNPYCAYGDRWSCPIPPPESDLDVSIKAGEKSLYSSSHH